MTVDEMISRKKELGYSYAQIAQLSGLPESTVQKVLGGITASPRYKTLKALEDVLKDNSADEIASAGAQQQKETARQGSAQKEKFACTESDVMKAGFLSENFADYGAARKLPEENVSAKENIFQNQKENIFADKSGKYTLDDYYALSDDQRVELIDGVFYDIASPSGIHQTIALRLAMIFMQFIDRNKGSCFTMIAPMDVQLNMDSKTMVQPDVMIICDRSKVKRRMVCGAPDLVVEILSGSTRSRDMVLKLNKYMNAGVREYWIVDPDSKEVIVCMFENDFICNIYDCSEPIPVGIFGGECRVDFKEIFDYAGFLADAEDE